MWILPPYESQYSAPTHTDANSCVSESLVHLVFMLTGKRYSPRALAKMSGTTRNGNDCNTVLVTANMQGLIPYEYWPTPDVFSWDDYYQPIPKEVLATAQKLDITLIKPNLSTSPLWTELQWGPDEAPIRHLVAQITDSTYFDSESGNPVKSIAGVAKVIWTSGIKINKLPMITNAKLVENKGEWGFFVPCTNEQALIDKALNFGYLIPTLENGSKVDWNNLRPDITI